MSQPLELSRTVRPWEFLPITGTRAALLGNETGLMEAWVYPVKIFREFHLKFLTEGRVLPAEALARTTATDPHAEYQNNYSELQTSSFRLGVTAKGKDTKLVVIGK